MKKKIAVKPYLRNGKLIKGHFRTIKVPKYPELREAYRKLN